MRLTIAQRQYIAFLALTLVVLLMTLGLASWNFESGFVAFVEAQQQQRLSSLGEDLLEEYANAGQSWALVDKNLLNRMLSPRRRAGSGKLDPPVAEGRRPPPLGGHLGPRPGPDLGSPGRLPPRAGPHQSDRPPKKQGDRGPGRGRQSNNSPTALFDQSGHYVAGAPGLDTTDKIVVIPLLFDGAPAGELRSLPRRRSQSPEEDRFVQRQRHTKWLIGLASLLVAAVVAYLLSSSIQRPIRRMTDGIKDLSNGEYKSRLQTARTDELGGLMNDLHRLATTLDEGQSARKRWLADISHELRTPLAALTAEIEALKDGVRSFSAERLASLDAQTSRLRLLVDDLYELSLSDVGGMRYSYEPLNLSAQVSGLVEQAQDRAVGLELRIDQAEPGLINADPLRIDQLVNNLLTNAITYTDAPGVIRLSVLQREGRVILEITDTPPGVDAQECERLFDPLYRREGSRDRNRGGAGLGLAICKNIATAHQAEIRAFPATTGGLCIRVDFPLLRV